MSNWLSSRTTRSLHHGLRKLFSFLPKPMRFAIYRSFVDFDPAPDPRLVLKIAETREELEACFTLLHDAYVNSGFMKPEPSGMRILLFHALPTTTTLCAKFDGKVVGTLSLIRENLLGFPMQEVFDLSEVRANKGQIAQLSSLAVHPSFRKTGGAILFPLMKFMYEYSTTAFDTRHVVIAVNPNQIEMYESLLYFKRLKAGFVENYDFANGAPAVAASLNLRELPKLLKRGYRGKSGRKSLYHYFVKLRLPNILVTQRSANASMDPVMTPETLDYFFNQRTPGFAKLKDREKALFYSLYDLSRYARYLPVGLYESDPGRLARQYQRYPFRCSGVFSIELAGQLETHTLTVVDCSLQGFLAYSSTPVTCQAWGEMHVQWGSSEKSTVRALAVGRKKDAGFYGFKTMELDLNWHKRVLELEAGASQIVPEKIQSVFP